MQYKDTYINCSKGIYEALITLQVSECINGKTQVWYEGLSPTMSGNWMNRRFMVNSHAEGMAKAIKYASRSGLKIYSVRNTIIDYDMDED